LVDFGVEFWNSFTQQSIYLNQILKEKDKGQDIPILSPY
jgi:hypothetical protein